MHCITYTPTHSWNKSTLRLANYESNVSGWNQILFSHCEPVCPVITRTDFCQDTHIFLIYIIAKNRVLLIKIYFSKYREVKEYMRLSSWQVTIREINTRLVTGISVLVLIHLWESFLSCFTRTHPKSSSIYRTYA